MKRMKSLQFMLFAVLLLILAACSNGAGQSQPASEEPRPSASQPSDQGAAETGTRTITHLKGEAVIPSEIDKIVVLTAEYIDHLLTIGEKPSGVNTEVRYGGEYLPYLADKLQGVQTVGSADNPNLEAITLLDPDVILIESRTAENSYEQLNKIAPTIVLGNEWLDYGDDTSFWTKDLLTIAEMYDKTDLAKEKIAELEQKTVQASGKIKALDSKNSPTSVYGRRHSKCTHNKVIQPMHYSIRISGSNLPHLRRKRKELIYPWRKYRSWGQTLSSLRWIPMPAISWTTCRPAHSGRTSLPYREERFMRPIPSGSSRAGGYRPGRDY